MALLNQAKEFRLTEYIKRQMHNTLIKQNTTTIYNLAKRNNYSDQLSRLSRSMNYIKQHNRGPEKDTVKLVFKKTHNSVSNLQPQQFRDKQASERQTSYKIRQSSRQRTRFMNSSVRTQPNQTNDFKRKSEYLFKIVDNYVKNQRYSHHQNAEENKKDLQSVAVSFKTETPNLKWYRTQQTLAKINIEKSNISLIKRKNNKLATKFMSNKTIQQLIGQVIH